MTQRDLPSTSTKLSKYRYRNEKKSPINMRSNEK